MLDLQSDGVVGGEAVLGHGTSDDAAEAGRVEVSRTAPDVSVVIVSHDHLAVLKTCLAALFSTISNVSFEVLVIENICTDRTGECVRDQYPRVRFVGNESPRGFAANVNMGVRLSGNSRYVLLANPDTECLPGMLDALVGFMNVNIDVGIAGPMLLNPDGTVQPSCRRFSTPGTLLARGLHFDEIGRSFSGLRRYLMEDFDHRSETDVDWVTGALLIVRRKAIADVGLMDDVRYFLYSEDQDWCCRMWQAGWRVCYVPQACARHAHMREGMKRPWSKAGRHQLRSALRMFRKFGWKLDRKVIS